MTAAVEAWSAAGGPPPFTSLVAGLDAANPFVGPEALERTTGHRFRARVGANESAFGMSPRARAAAADALERLSWYGDPENYALRADLAAYHGVAVNQVLVGAGIDDLLALVVRAFATAGGRAVMALGSYPTFAYHAATFGVALDTAPYGGDDYVDLAALAVQARDSETVRVAGAAGVGSGGATVVYLANPDNPSGTWLPEAAVRDFLTQLPARAWWRSTRPTSTTPRPLRPARCSPTMRAWSRCAPSPRRTAWPGRASPTRSAMRRCAPGSTGCACSSG